MKRGIREVQIRPLKPSQFELRSPTVSDFLRLAPNVLCMFLSRMDEAATECNQSWMGDPMDYKLPFWWLYGRVYGEGAKDKRDQRREAEYAGCLKAVNTQLEFFRLRLQCGLHEEA